MSGSGPRLGRGLAALLGDPGGSPAGTVRNVPIEALEAGPFQPRGPMDAEALDELADSIRRRGILQPILARPLAGVANRYQIIAGERRWRAAQKAGLHDVPVFVRDLPDSDAMAAALVENLQRQDLNAIEEAEGYRRLIEEFGLTQERLGEAVGKSRSHVANALRLLNLPEPVQRALKAGTLTAGHARALLAHPDPEAAAQQVMARGLNVRQTEALAQQRAAQPEDRPDAPEKDAETLALQRGLSEQLGLRVEISHGVRGGSLRISYRSLDQLDRLVALLRG
jgi:ParB family chromosome partitioning protein